MSAKQLARGLARGVARQLAGSGVGSSEPWTPLSLGANLAQYSLDGGLAYSETQVDGRYVLRELGTNSYPAVVSTPCFTGAGLGSYCDLNSQLFPSTGDFTATCWYLPGRAASGNIATIFSQGTAYGDAVMVQEGYGGSNGMAVGRLGLYVAGWVATTLEMVAGVWVLIEFSRVGNVFTVKANGVTSGSTTNALSIGAANTHVGRFFDGNYSMQGRCTDVRIASGGVTTYFPLQDGPGASNTNRDIAYIKSDGNYGVVSNSITLGSSNVAAIWANRCPGHVKDWCIEYGGQIGGAGQFVPAILDSSVCANGSAVALTPGKFGNPFSRIDFDFFDEAALSGIGLESAYSVGTARRTVSPEYTKFRRTSDFGDDRFFSTFEPLSGSHLTNALAYTETPEPTPEEATAAYQLRIEEEGDTLSATGYAAVLEVFQAAEDNGVTVSSGWLFGSEVNTSGLTRIINLKGSSPDLVPIGTPDAATNLTSGMVGVRTTATEGGFETEDGSGIFDNSSDYNFLCIGSATGDYLTDSTQKLVFIYKQDDASATGSITYQWVGTGADLWLERPASTTAIPQATRDNSVQPVMHWVECNSDATYRIIHPGEEVATDYLTFGGDPSTSAFQVAPPYQDGDVGLAMIIRFDGSLTDAQRKDIFDRVYAKWRSYGTAAIVVGNSVTDGGSPGFHCWPHKLQEWGIHNNTLVIRQAEGGRRLQYFAPTGYTMPEGTSDIALSGEPVNIHDWYAANLIVNDENQNAVAYGHDWPTFLDCHNAIVAYFQTLNDEPVKAVVGTQMPYPAHASGTPLTYAQVLTDLGGYRVWFRDVSVAARAATSSDFADVTTEIADIYFALNLGWDVGDDGDAIDPANDVPNGDPDLFPADDHQHPNADGHTVMFEVYRDATIAVLA